MVEGDNVYYVSNRAELVNLDAKGDGMRWFDVGTIIPGTADPKLKGLTLFKTRFGGVPHRYLRCEMALPAAAPMELAPVAPSLQEAGEAGVSVSKEQPVRRGHGARIRRAIRRALGQGL